MQSLPKLPPRVDLKVPWLDQWDNKLEPQGTCNTTATAGCMMFRGIVGDGNGQLEDQLTRKCFQEGWDRHMPDTIQKLFAWKKVKSRFTTKATQEEVKRHLASGGPCIVHGWFTRSGHIIVIRGYDDTAYGGKGAFIVNDSNGEWSPRGYTYQPGAGVGALYSYDMIRRVCQPDGQFFVHFC